MRPVTILAVGLMASGTTAMFVYRAVQNPVSVRTVTADSTANVQVRPVVVASGDVPFGTKLTEQHLKVVDWPVTALPENVVDARDKLVGRTVLARMVANEPITTDKLAPADSRGLLALVIEPGMRGVTVRVNEVAAVGGFIATGSRVDVLVTAELKTVTHNYAAPGAPAAANAGNADQRHTRTVLQNVTVVAIGQQLESNGQPKPGEGAALTTATLLVTPEQAEMLALGAAEGTLQLVLRSFEDNKIVHSSGKSAQDLFDVETDDHSLAAANRVEMIRGAERLDFSF